MEATKRLKRTSAAKPLTLRLRGPLGLALDRYRRAKGLGLNELARLAKVEPAQLSRLEGGHQVSAHASTLRKLAAALDVDVDHLMRLAAISRAHAWTTESTDEDFVGALIVRDPTIPRKRKKWLLECLALARK